MTTEISVMYGSEKVNRVTESRQPFQSNKLQGLRLKKNGKLIDFWGYWNPITVLLTGFQKAFFCCWSARLFHRLSQDKHCH